MAAVSQNAVRAFVIVGVLSLYTAFMYPLLTPTTAQRPTIVEWIPSARATEAMLLSSALRAISSFCPSKFFSPLPFWFTNVENGKKNGQKQGTNASMVHVR
jgi:hypothetical protein